MTLDAPPPSVAVLGGGITGLAAALRLEEADHAVDWRLFEASERLGGVIETAEQDGYRIDLSADNFLTRDPWATDLCRRVGIEEELLPTDPARRRAMVVCRGKIERVPRGFVLMSPQAVWPTLASPILSLRGKLRLACEPFIARRRHGPGDDESLESFARRRLGDEAFERLVQPLVSGIYTADPKRLGLAATLPQFLRQETEHGSLLRAAMKKPKPAEANERGESGARYGQFVAPRLGMEQIVHAIATRLPGERVATGSPVATCERVAGDRWRLAGPGGEPLGEFDAVIVTLPAHHAAGVLRGADAELAEELSRIEYAGASVVCLGVRTEQVAKPIDGFGFVVPSIEGRRLIAASFASYKFPGRAPVGRLLIRVFVGGALQPGLADLGDSELIALACEELAGLVGLTGEPELARVARWPRRMPQYHVGHLGRVERIEQLADRLPGLRLAGAAYRGVGVPQCVRSGEEAADRALADVRHSPERQDPEGSAQR